MEQYTNNRLLGFHKIVYLMNENGVKVRESTLTSSKEVTIDYDRIGHDPTIHKQHTVLALILSIACYTLAAYTFFFSESDMQFFWIVWAILGSVFLMFYLPTRKSGVILASDHGRLVIEGKPSRIKPFSEKLASKKKAYIEDYCKMRLKATGREDVEKYLIALLDAGVLAKRDYIDLQENLNSEKFVGFSQTS